MRIVIDHQVTSLQDAGGMSRYHYELGRHLRGRPDIFMDYLLGGTHSVLPFRQLEGAGLRVIGWTTGLPAGYPRYAMNALATAAIAPWRGRYDIYHATYQRWERSIRHRCLVATHHDSTQERFPQLFRNAAAIRERKGRLYRRADMVICVSESARQDLLEIYGVDASRARVVHHGVSPLPHQPLPLQGQEERPSATPEPYILYVGSRSAYKNFSALLRAFAGAADCRSFRLLAAGGGPWTRAETEAIEQLGLADRVDLAPRVEEDELTRLYRDATLFVYPSLYEGFGFPPLEAMSAGCPVLVSRTAALPEICGHAAFYFDPTGEGSLQEELSCLLADAALRRSKVETGRVWIERYTWEKSAEATLGVYRDVSGRRSSGQTAPGHHNPKARD